MRIPVPEGLPEALKMSEAEFAAEVRFLLAAKLYELGRVSAGLAAELADLDRLTFLASLARYGAPAINLRDEEVTREIEAARKLGEGRGHGS
ncbi:UPF0175 family protein [Ammonifex degensii]|nr:UPF0175 family protein [Ammonifex degensii]